ncbi:two-component sensor histidine kinase [Streptomyces antimycoticus]|uniref:Two-component sensor histidine kinase n=1 Tax=Streptomyces antimycoticus TaxID=68175 RepID=A0A499UHV1_9ACTN|nr:two-component sensor histidine kinase [Streptomyces antimycoticus]
MADRAEWTDGDPERRPGVLRRLTWWADAMAYDDENDRPAAIGQSPENRRQALIKLMWIGIWMAYMGAPVSDLVDGHHTVPATVCGALGLLAFVAIYLVLVFRHTGRALSRAAVFGALGTSCVLAAVLTLTMGDAWLVLCVYVSVAYGAVLPLRLARWAIPLNTAFMVTVGVLVRGSHGLVSALVIPSLLGGFAMSGVRQMVRTTRALRAARATVAQLAANEERLRLARDLHDLLGHSLSLITLKSELAGRMLPDKPEQAARQVADIERVSRQALVDVREAVSGFRRPTLEAEVAGARTALAAAGVAADLSRAAAHHADLPPDQEGALAWALREAVTNVVRHSGARRCAVTLDEMDDELCLTVTDDGRGATGPHGNGLTGLAERLQLADGRLETGPGERGGFVLRALVPLSRGVRVETPSSAAP